MNIFQIIIGIWALFGLCTFMENADNTLDFWMNIQNTKKKVLCILLFIFMYGPLMWAIVILALVVIGIGFAFYQIFRHPARVIIRWKDNLKKWFLA